MKKPQSLSQETAIARAPDGELDRGKWDEGFARPGAIPGVLGEAATATEGGVKALYDDRPLGRSCKPLARAKEAEIITGTHDSNPNGTATWN